MKAQTIINSGITIAVGLALARLVAPRLGYPAGRFIADRLAHRRGLAWVRAIRANQWVLSGGRLSARELDRAALDVFRHQAHCLFDLWHSRQDRDALQALSPLNDAMAELIDRSRSRHGAAVVVFPHLSNFDVTFIANAYRGLQAQVLTLAQPSGGYLVHNRLRRVEGFEITPVSDEATRLALARLRHGGMVMTGIDRPVEGKKRSLTFFGQQSFLPAGHIRLALAAGVPVIAAGVIMSAAGQYEFFASDPLPMCADGDEVTCIRRNAEMVLETIAGFIARAPRQWLMYYPLWPQLQSQVPV
ncbi:MAG TPA: hypothetical protein VGA61_08195 [Anaerolineae bacterium]